jgi:hypothetical protein
MVASLCGCGGNGPEPARQPRQSVIGEPLQQALDRAESVQDTVDEHAAQLREQLEAAEAD